MRRSEVQISTSTSMLFVYTGFLFSSEGERECDGIVCILLRVSDIRDIEIKLEIRFFFHELTHIMMSHVMCVVFLSLPERSYIVYPYFSL